MKKLVILIIIYTVPVWLFGQPNDSLEYYIKYAIKNNPGLTAEYKAYESSLEKVPQFKSLPDPTVSFGYFINPAETRLGPQRAKISITQMFPWFGTLNTKGKQAAYLAQAAYFDYVSSKNKLSYLIKKDYYELFLIRKSKEIIKQQTDILGMLEQQALIKSETGQVSIAEFLQFQMAKDELNNKLLNLTIEEKNAIVQFNTLLNRKHDTEILIPDSVYLIEEHSFSKDSILKFNPTVKRAKELINYSDQLLRESKLLRYPKIGIGLDYVFVGERQDLNPEGNGKDIVMPMISMSIPIFGKKNKAKINESKLKSEEFNLKKEALENDLIAEFESGLFDLESAINDYKLYQELIIKADRTLAILRTAYETSGKDYDQVLSLENKVLAYRLGVLKALVKIKTTESYLEYLSNQ